MATAGKKKKKNWKAEKWVTAEHEIRSCGGKTDENYSMNWSVERKIMEQFLWNLSINREPSASKKKKRTEEKGKYRKREQIHTQQRQREQKKRGTDRESNIKQRRNTQHKFVYGISPVPFFSLSLSLSLK